MRSRKGGGYEHTQIVLSTPHRACARHKKERTIIVLLIYEEGEAKHEPIRETATSKSKMSIFMPSEILKYFRIFLEHLCHNCLFQPLSVSGLLHSRRLVFYLF